MAQFNLSDTVDSSKVFLVKRSELEGKFEVSYYLPEIKKLEDKIRSNTKKKLKDFIIKLSSGATPLVTEEAKFYSDKENGIPFLRVQNLQTNGKLSTDDVKFINQETHDNYLKRSQVSEGDLLVKITGVGRMAIASVAPDGFIGNTNQHMVVIKTKSKKESEYLANYLNLDIVEKLATRRATGGTRPALDYPALKSIPIIENIDFSIIEKAELLKQQKEAQAKELLASIDTYLLNELGITLPEKDTSLQSRINTNVRLKDITGSRFDPMLYDKNTIALKEAIINVNEDKFITKPLKKFVIKSVAGDWGLDENDNVINEEFEKCLVIRATEFDNDYNLKLDNSRVKYRLIKKDKLEKIDIQEDDLLIEKSGGSPDQPVGRISILTKDILVDNSICCSNFIHKIRVDSSKLNPYYLFCFLKTIHNIKLTEAMQSQTNGIRNLIMSTYLNQTIVLPIKSDGSFDLEKQTEIANHIQDIRTQAKQLQEEAKEVLEEAKREVEKMILGE
jgi:hypothetical protein